MDTTKSSREDAARRPKQKAAGAAPRRNPAEASGRRKPSQEGAVQTAQRPRGERRPTGEEAVRTRREAARNPQEARQRKTAPSQKKAPPPSGKSGTKPQRSAPRKERPDDLSSKKRAYGNSKPKKKSSAVIMGEALVATIQENTERRRARQEAKGRRPKRPQQPTPAVIYTQPQVFNRDRLMIQLITVTAVVVAFVVGISVFFKVGRLEVTGANVYEEAKVVSASGIQAGDNLLTFSRARAGALIKANLPYVKNVSFGIRLPDTVNIIIEEEDVVYAIKDQDEQWWLINSDGYVVDQSNKGEAANYTQVLGVALDHPLRDQMGFAVEEKVTAPDPTADPEVETEETVQVPVTVTGKQRLDIALQILKALEANDIVGDAASINVGQIQNITLWYGTRYQVLLGNDANLEEKIGIMNDVILQMNDYQSGILDISFTIWPNQVGYTPFG